MSYILDALRRAETQRQRAVTPGLHSLHLTPEALPAKKLSRSAAPWLLGVALVVGVLAAAFWVWLSTPDSPAAPVPASEASTIADSSADKTLLVAPARAVKTKPPGTGESTPPAATAKSAESVKSGATSAAAASVIVWLADLPADLRSSVPKIAITGSVYADAPGQRLLLVNNLVLTQGQTLAPDLVLEEIQQHSSVFNFHGTRFRVAH